MEPHATRSRTGSQSMAPGKNKPAKAASKSGGSKSDAGAKGAKAKTKKAETIKETQAAGESRNLR